METQATQAASSASSGQDAGAASDTATTDTSTPTGQEAGGASDSVGLIDKPAPADGEKKTDGDADKTTPAEKSEAVGLDDGFGAKKPEKEEEVEAKPTTDAEPKKGDDAGSGEVVITLPAGTIVPDQSAMDAFATFANSDGVKLSSEQASALAAYQINAMAEAETAARIDRVERAQVINQKWEKELLNDPDIGGGDQKKYAKATEIATKGFKKFGGDGVAEYLVDLSGGKEDWAKGESVNLTLQPAFFRMFHALGMAMGEDSATVGVGGGQPGDLTAEQKHSKVFNHSTSQQARDGLAGKGG